MEQDGAVRLHFLAYIVLLEAKGTGRTNPNHTHTMCHR
jgi:hypothetical protein